MISVFLSCPVRPVGDETKDGNLDRALEYYRVLSIALPSHAFIMPWWVNCKVFPETPEQIAIGMMRNKYWIRHCDQLWWCGPRVSGGMQEEGNYARGRLTRVGHDRVRRVIMNQAPPPGTGQLIIGTFDVLVPRADAELFRVAA